MVSSVAFSGLVILVFLFLVPVVNLILTISLGGELVKLLMLGL